MKRQPGIGAVETAKCTVANAHFERGFRWCDEGIYGREMAGFDAPGRCGWKMWLEIC
jgi:hypothetical protein